MKIDLIYNYNFQSPIINVINNIIYIYEKRKKFILEEVDNIEELKEIYKILITNKIEENYYRIIKTKKDNIIMKHKQKNYVLLEIRETKQSKIKINSNNSILNKSNWYILWNNKNEFYSSKTNSIVSKYKELEGILEYYVGMAENAVGYLKQHNDTNYHNSLYITSRRYENLCNPTNIIIDCKERLFVEKIKYYYFKLNVDINIKKITMEIQQKKLSPHRVIARLLYPTQFFDIIDNLENTVISNKYIKTNIKKIYSYEKAIKELITNLQKYYKIKNIDWL